MMRDRGLVAAITLAQEARDSADRRHADGRAVVDLAVCHAPQQVRHDAPTVDQRFELGRCAQVAQERTHLGDRVERQQSAAQALLDLGRLGFRFERTAFHCEARMASNDEQCINALVH